VKTFLVDNALSLFAGLVFIGVFLVIRTAVGW
jgi:hypothetical protein